MAIGDLYKCTLHFSQGLRTWQNTLHYEQIAGVDDNSSANEACAAVNALMRSEIEDVLNLETRFNFIEWHTVEGANRVPGSFRSAAPGNGNVIDQPAPLNLAVVMRLKTDAPRGQANGRLFISGIGELQVFSGTLGPAQVTDFNTWGASIATNLASVGLGDVIYQPVVISRVEFGEDRPVPIGNRIISVDTQAIIYTQRSRKTKASELAYTLGG